MTRVAEMETVGLREGLTLSARCTCCTGEAFRGGVQEPVRKHGPIRRKEDQAGETDLEIIRSEWRVKPRPSVRHSGRGHRGKNNTDLMGGRGKETTVADGIKKRTQ